MRTTRIGPTILTASTVLLALAACTGSPGAASTTTSATPTPTSDATTATATSSASTSASTPVDGGSASPSPSASCGPYNATTAVQKAVITLPRPIPSLPSAHWDAPNADVSGYDRCADLSWAVVSVEGGTPSSPNAILLFHDGAFLGTATKTQYPFQPTIARTSDAAIAVTYRYAKPSDANANPSGSTKATYTWDSAVSRVVMTGSVPPRS